ncbi:MAG: hypothetical protein RLZZ272_288 [Actinomycetota bacterium]
MSVPADEPLLVLDPFDTDLLGLDDWSLLRRLGRTTLLRLPGTGQARPRAVVTLQHGDEPSGLQALLRVLRRRHRFPFDLHVVIGNVEAALEPPGFAHRFLPRQRDMNRLWTMEVADDAQAAAVIAAREHLRRLAPSSIVDLHNTSGANPFHAIVTRTDVASLDLALRFTTTVVHWEQRVGALMEAFDDGTPAIAIECGLAGRPGSLAFALDGIRRWLAGPDPSSTAELPDHDLLGPMRRVLIDPAVRLRFGGAPDAEVEVTVPIDADRRNGIPTPAGWTLAEVAEGRPMPFRVVEPDGRDVTDTVLALEGRHVVVVVDSTPLMMTRTVDAARKDCLTYLLGTRTLPTATEGSHPSAPLAMRAPGRVPGWTAGLRDVAAGG